MLRTEVKIRGDKDNHSFRKKIFEGDAICLYIQGIGQKARTKHRVIFKSNMTRFSQKFVFISKK